MSDKNVEKAKRLERRKFSVRSNIFGTQQRPRLSVYRSGKHIYAQLIDDMAGKTLAAVATTSPEVRGALKHGANVAAAKAAGKAIAERGKAAGITAVAFDRGGRMYHGRVKALADAAREAGLKF
jgi:large subunit ribosomal protein L18